MSRREVLSIWVGWLRRALRQRMVVTGGMLLVAIASASLIGPFFSPYDPNALTMNFLKPPSSDHWFGTDSFGRDVFVRSLLGTRMSLGIGLTTAVLSSFAGTLVGLAAVSFRRGGPLLMRAMDAIMAFPALLLAMAVLAAMGRNVANIIIALGLVYTPRTARIVQAAALSVREETFVEAARALGIAPLWILLRHVLPNVFAPLLVQATFVFAYGVLAEAGLSFIGVGIQPPTPSLGNILGDARAMVREAPWVTFFPGGLIFALVMTINLLGDGLREALDPQLRRMFKGG